MYLTWKTVIVLMVLLECKTEKLNSQCEHGQWSKQEACFACVTHVCLFVCFVALRPKSTAMVIAGRSVHLTTLFPGQA